MADNYANEANAGFRITGFLWNSVAKCLGRVRASIEKIVEREVIQADGNNTPTSRPVNVLDARGTLEFLDQAGGLSHTTAAALAEFDYTEANGSAGSIQIGNMLMSSVHHNWGRNMGGFGIGQDMELEGALTYTVSS